MDLQILCYIYVLQVTKVGSKFALDGAFFEGFCKDLVC